MKTITSKKAARLLPGLLPDDNKYTRGLCELVVGDPIYAGAGVLAVMAATRMGAGYVRAYTSFETAAALRVVQLSIPSLSMNMRCARGIHAPLS